MSRRHALPPLSALAVHPSRPTRLYLADRRAWPARVSSLRARAAGQWLAGATMDPPPGGRCDPFCVALWPDCPEGLLLLDVETSSVDDEHETGGGASPEEPAVAKNRSAWAIATHPPLRPRPLLVTSDEAVLEELAAASAALPVVDCAGRNEAESSVHCVAAAMRHGAGPQQLAVGAAAAVQRGWLVTAEAVLARAVAWAHAAAADDSASAAADAAPMFLNAGGYSLLATAAACGSARAVALVLRMGALPPPPPPRAEGDAPRGVAHLFGAPWGDARHCDRRADAAAAAAAPAPPAPRPAPLTPLHLAADLALSRRHPPEAAVDVAAQLLASSQPAGEETSDGAERRRPAFDPHAVLCWVGFAPAASPPTRHSSTPPALAPSHIARASNFAPLLDLDARVRAAYADGASAAKRALEAAEAADVAAAAASRRTLPALSFGARPAGVRERMCLLAASIFLHADGLDADAEAVAAAVLAAEARAAATPVAWRGVRDAAQAPRMAAYSFLLLLLSLASLARSIAVHPFVLAHPPACDASGAPHTLSYAAATRVYAGGAALWAVCAACSALLLVFSGAACAPRHRQRNLASRARAVYLSSSTPLCSAAFAVIHIAGPVMMETHARRLTRCPSRPVAVPCSFLPRHVIAVAVVAAFPLAAAPKTLLLVARCALAAASRAVPTAPLWPALALCPGPARFAVEASHLLAAAVACAAERRAARAFDGSPPDGLFGDASAAAAAIATACRAASRRARYAASRAVRGCVLILVWLRPRVMRCVVGADDPSTAAFVAAQRAPGGPHARLAAAGGLLAAARGAARALVGWRITRAAGASAAAAAEPPLARSATLRRLLLRACYPCPISSLPTSSLPTNGISPFFPFPFETPPPMSWADAKALYAFVPAWPFIALALCPAVIAFLVHTPRPVPRRLRSFLASHFEPLLLSIGAARQLSQLVLAELIVRRACDPSEPHHPPHLSSGALLSSCVMPPEAVAFIAFAGLLSCFTPTRARSRAALLLARAAAVALLPNGHGAFHAFALPPVLARVASPRGLFYLANGAAAAAAVVVERRAVARWTAQRRAAKRA